MSRTKAPDQNYRVSKAVLEKAAGAKAKPVVLRLPTAHPKQFELITALETDPTKRFIFGACGSKSPAPRFSVV